MLKRNVAKAGSSEASRSLPSLVGIRLVVVGRNSPSKPVGVEYAKLRVGSVPSSPANLRAE